MDKKLIQIPNVHISIIKLLFNFFILISHHSLVRMGVDSRLLGLLFTEVAPFFTPLISFEFSNFLFDNQ